MVPVSSEMVSVSFHLVKVIRHPKTFECEKAFCSMPADKRASIRGTKRAGVRDVAEIAGVAPITVSRALRLPETVAPETRQRIAEAVASLGYIPNRVAGGLSSNRTRLIGAIIPTFQS
jgi:hypothetical protein